MSSPAATSKIAVSMSIRPATCAHAATASTASTAASASTTAGKLRPPTSSRPPPSSRPASRIVVTEPPVAGMARPCAIVSAARIWTSAPGRMP
jgi:hypothetical protein